MQKKAGVGRDREDEEKKEETIHGTDAEGAAAAAASSPLIEPTKPMKARAAARVSPWMAAAVRPIHLFFPWRHHLLLPLLSLFLILLLRSAAAAEDNTQADEAAALLKLKASFQNAAAPLSSWADNSKPCDANKPWKGVVCFHGVVTGLRLGGMGLSGKIDVEALSRLQSLRTVSFIENSFSGTMPELQNLQALKAIYLSKNSFSGAIPDTFFSQLGHMKKIWINGNAFDGNIPTSIAKLTLLMELHLEDNQFHGPIPNVALPSLKSFNVSNNRLEGAIPTTLERFGETSFAGNADLCGPPLGDKPCDDRAAVGAAATHADGAAGSGKTSTALAVCIVLLGLIILAVVLKKKRESGFETLGVENDYVEGVEVSVASGSSHGGSTSKSRQHAGTHGGSASSKKGSVKSGMGDLVMVDEERGQFGLADLMKAAAEVLGNGGLGSAYKAVMGNGVAVVVKRMKEMNRLTKDVFDMEMRKLGRLRHPNVITPLAYHYRKEEKLLVFEYMEKGSLLYILHGDRGPYHAALDWPTRLKILVGIGRGMAYLHTELQSGAEIPHGNLKSGNVLLGKDFEPLIIDYGYTPMVNPSQASQVMFAYRSPEFIHYRHISAKSDVYCLGVVILEVLTGKFPSQYLNNGKGGTDVVQWVSAAIAEKREAELIDPEIASGPGSGPAAVCGMERLLRLGIALAEPNPDRRPDMKEASKRIEEIAADPGKPDETPPQKPTVSVVPAPSLKDGVMPATATAELTTKQSGREAAPGERSTRKPGGDNFEFSIS